MLHKILFGWSLLFSSFVAFPRGVASVKLDAIVWPAYSTTLEKVLDSQGVEYISGHFLEAKILEDLRNTPVLQRVRAIIAHATGFNILASILGWGTHPLDVRMRYLTSNGCARALVVPVHTSMRVRVGEETAVIMNNHGWELSLVRDSLKRESLSILVRDTQSNALVEKTGVESLKYLVLRTFEGEIQASIEQKELQTILTKMMASLFLFSTLDEHIHVRETPDTYRPDSLGGLLGASGKHLCNDDAKVQKAAFDYMMSVLGNGSVWGTAEALRERAQLLEKEINTAVVLPAKEAHSRVHYYSTIGFIHPNFPGNCDQGINPEWPSAMCSIKDPRHYKNRIIGI